MRKNCTILGLLRGAAFRGFCAGSRALFRQQKRRVFTSGIKPVLIFAVLFLLCHLLLPQSSKAVKWTYLTKTHDGTISIFVDRESIEEVSENVFTSCQRFEYAKPVFLNSQKGAVTQIVAHRQWDCVEEKYNNLQVTFYFLDGTTEREDYKFALWRHIMQDTPEYDLYDFVCNQE